MHRGLPCRVITITMCFSFQFLSCSLILFMIAFVLRRFQPCRYLLLKLLSYLHWRMMKGFLSSVLYSSPLYDSFIVSCIYILQLILFLSWFYRSVLMGSDDVYWQVFFFSLFFFIASTLLFLLLTSFMLYIYTHTHTYVLSM